MCKLIEYYKKQIKYPLELVDGDFWDKDSINYQGSDMFKFITISKFPTGKNHYRISANEGYSHFPDDGVFLVLGIELQVGVDEPAELVVETILEYYKDKSVGEVKTEDGESWFDVVKLTKKDIKDIEKLLWVIEGLNIITDINELFVK